MSLADWLLLAAIAAAVLLSLRHIRRHKGGCCGDCTRCSRCTRPQSPPRDGE